MFVTSTPACRYNETPAAFAERAKAKDFGESQKDSSHHGEHHCASHAGQDDSHFRR